MMRLPGKPSNRSWTLVLACLLAGPVVPSFAQQAAPGVAAPAPADAPAINPAVLKAVGEFWHFASVANYDAAKASGEALLAMNADPMEVYRAFEQVVRERNARQPVDRRIVMEERLLSWQRRDQLKEIVPKLIDTFRAARLTRRSDPAFIEENIRRLATNRLAYTRGVENLRDSGELAVPIMLAYLRDPAQQNLHADIRTALRDLGIRALHPLTAATYAKDLNTLLAAVTALGDIGYDNAVPYLVRLVQDAETAPSVKAAATQSLLRLGVNNPAQVNAAQAFFDLGRKFYYDSASIVAAKESPTSPIWRWSGDGLAMIPVPSAVFNEDKALEACEQAIRLDAGMSEAVSLWLAAGYKREVELPQGAADPAWGSRPPTHVYAVTSGTRHLNPVLDRAANEDRNSAVALKAIKSLQEIVGASNLFAGGATSPVLAALTYPDRQVRIEAALTVAGAMPREPFAGSDRVVATLGEAIAQTGKSGVLIVAASQDELNKQRESLGKTFNVEGGTSATAAIAASGSLPAVDVIIVRETQAAEIDQLRAAQRENTRLSGAALLIIVTSDVASPFVSVAQGSPMISVTTASDEAGLNQAIENARRRAGSLTMDEQSATSYAMRATQLVGKLAATRTQALDLTGAQAALLGALDDPRADLSKAAGDALSMIGTKEAQAGLANKTKAENTPDEMKVHFLRNLAVHAKNYGNQHDAAAFAWLTSLVESATNLDVRSAAAEAHGALNLPPDHVRKLILNPAPAAAGAVQ